MFYHLLLCNTARRLFSLTGSQKRKRSDTYCFELLEIVLVLGPEFVPAGLVVVALRFGHSFPFLADDGHAGLAVHILQFQQHLGGEQLVSTPVKPADTRYSI